MVKGRFTIYHWLVLWGIIAILANSTLSFWGYWAAIVAGVFAVLGLLIHSYGWSRRKIQLRKLSEVYYEPQPNNTKDSWISNTSPDSQDVRITLHLKAGITLGYINLDFQGIGQIPNMYGLYDWNLGQEHPDFRWLKRPDGSWNCTIIRQPHRNIGARIRVGILCKASKPFNGNLKVVLNCEEGKTKPLLLPFEVKEDSTGNGESN